MWKNDDREMNARVLQIRKSVIISFEMWKEVKQVLLLVGR